MTIFHENNDSIDNYNAIIDNMVVTSETLRTQSLQVSAQSMIIFKLLNTCMLQKTEKHIETTMTDTRADPKTY